MVFMFTRVYETVGGCWGSPVYPVFGDIREKRPPASVPFLFRCRPPASCGGDGSACSSRAASGLASCLDYWILIQHDKRISILHYSFLIILSLSWFIGFLNKSLFS